MPVTVKTRKSETIVEADEGPRRDTTLEKLSVLKPAFKEGGSVTAGNSSSLNDRAAAVMVVSDAYARAHGLQPLAKIRSIAVAGVPPRVMVIGPVPATKKALGRAGINLDDIGLIELNEAFAAQSLAVLYEWGMDPEDERLNPNGGAIALGHPSGASGARILTTLVHEMGRRDDVQFGLATMCIGVGQGIAAVIEAARGEAHVAQQASGIAHPPYLYPDYRSTRLRAPKEPLTIVPRTLTELTGPAYGRGRPDPLDHDLRRQHEGEPLGERIIVHGRLLDGDGRPVRDSLVEIWQANAAGRYQHPEDRRDDLPDAEGRFEFLMVKLGPVPGPDGDTLQAPHIAVSIFARGLLRRVVTRICFFRAIIRPSFSMSEALFGPIFVPDEFREAVGGRAWLQAMLDAVRALAIAEARVGLIPTEAADAIASRCDARLFDPEEIGSRGRAVGNPVPPLVRALTEAVSEVSEDAARYVHKGATSQDITDTAAMLITKRTLGLILAEVDRVAAACARLAEAHRETLMAGRTLLQQALPTTFGLKAAGWLVSILEVRRRLLDVRRSGLAAQLGGAAGTLASLGNSGIPVLEEFARELALAEPVVPWHTDRSRPAEVGGALSLVAGAVGKISLDVILMAQTEVGEVEEPPPAGSATLPHKRNPVLSVTASASARRVLGLSHTLQSAIVGEYERAAGAWHSEWQTLSRMLALTGGAAAAIREVTEGLQVNKERMRENLNRTRGMLLAESVTTVAAERIGRLKAHDLVEAACRRVLDEGRNLREELLDDPEIGGVLSTQEIDAALDPAGYLGSAGEFVDRALDLYCKEVSA